MKKCIEKGRRKKQGRPDISERPHSAALLACSFSPLPVPTGGSDFPPEPSAFTGSRRIPCYHLQLLVALQLEPLSVERFFKGCCATATMLASPQGGT
jgi:hypothetical protein